VKALEDFSIFIVALDLHQGVVFLMHPNVDDVVSAAFAGIDESNFMAFLELDRFFADDFRVRPVEETERKIFVGEIGSHDRLAKLFGWEGYIFAIDDLEEIEFFFIQAHVEDVPLFVFLVLELNVFSTQKESDRGAFTIFAQGAVEIGLLKRGGKPDSFDGVLGGGIGMH